MNQARDVLPWSANAELLYEFTLPMATPSNNEIRDMHFFTYRALRKQWQKMVYAALAGRRPEEAISKAFLVIERHSAGSGLDWDNAYGGLKPLLDCLVKPSKRNPDGLGLIEDDNPSSMPLPPFLSQSSAKRGQGSTVVKIYRILDSQES